MDLQTFEVAVTIAFLCVLGLGVGLFAGLNSDLYKLDKRERRSHNDLWDQIYYNYSSKSDVERFFHDHEERLNAVYKHLGIKAEKKVTPAKEEVVVSRVK